MTFEEKLRFLADRIKDGKEFYIGIQQEPTKFMNEMLYYSDQYTGDWEQQNFNLKEILSDELHLEKQKYWEFTLVDKIFLQHIRPKYEWIARDEDGELCVFVSKPTKKEAIWFDKHCQNATLSPFWRLFEEIKWEDEEPCEFRKYL